MATLDEMIEEVRKVFPDTLCVGYNAVHGYCVYWPTEMCPVVATGQHPKSAWKNAYKKIRGKNKKALEKLKQSLLEQDAKKGNYGPQY